MNPEGRLHKGVDFVFTFFLSWIFGVYIHEWSHVLVGQALGWKATVSFPYPWAGWAIFPDWQSIPFLHIVIIALAGGLGVCALYLIWAYFTSDWEHNMALFYFATLHGVYAIFEVGYILHKVPVVVLGIVPALIALIPLAYKMLKNNRIEDGH